MIIDRIKQFFRRETVFCISLLAALISCFFVPPDAGYLQYVNLRTLALLYCLMAVVAGARQTGAFDKLAGVLCRKASGTRSVCLILVLLCFFCAMFITNDVALLTFVPFTLLVFEKDADPKIVVSVIVLQTAAANLGSILTPVGNPQNLYIQSFYDLSTSDFIGATLPVWLVSLFCLVLLCFRVPRRDIPAFQGQNDLVLDRRKLLFYLLLFGVCLLAVLRVIEWPLMLAIILAALLIFDRPTLLQPDFCLLFTFVFFFIFSGNLARLESVRILLEQLLAGREYWAGLAFSQIISNVPAALLLSGFTQNARQLLLGVNVGGLGTPVASLASLISLKFYTRSAGADTGRYMLEFTVINVLLIIILTIVVCLM